MDRFQIEVAARLSLHEFLLEIQMANDLRQRPEQAQVDFLDDLRRKVRSMHLADASAAAAPETDAIGQAIVAIGHDFADRLEQRLRGMAAG